MSRSPQSARLTEALSHLNDRQREACLHDGHLVVLAGPGSGKARVLTVRAAHLLAESVPRRSAISAITYTNAAADEMRDRLGVLGLPRSRRVSVATAHAFFLNEVLLAHRDLLPTRLPESFKILSERAATALQSAVLGKYGIPRTFDTRLGLTRARRMIATVGTLDDTHEYLSAAAATYSERLIQAEVLDFEEVIIRALQALQDPAILALVSNRFTHFLVDEYQDMGPVLHSIVSTLKSAGVQISAVGDPNQSVLGFTGASPTYLYELCECPDFRTVELELNYRSAGSLVSAAARFLNAGAPGQRHVRDVEGMIHHIRVNGDQSAHAAQAVAVVEQHLSAGTSPSEIALLYPRSGPFLSAILEELDNQGIQYFHDRADVIPRGPLARWLSRTALRSTLSDTPGGELPIDLTIPALATELSRISHQKGRQFRRCVGRGLATRFRQPGDSAESVSDFTSALSDALGLEELVASLPEESDQEDFAQLLQLEEVPMAVLASSVSRASVTLTTFQSAKGREFDVVVIPALVEGTIPLWASTGPPEWRREPPDPESIAEERRAFYVAVTRARDELYLITGSGWTNRGGYWELRDKGPSRFALELLAHLD